MCQPTVLPHHQLVTGCKLGVGKETTLGKTIQPKEILVEEFSFELTAVQLFKKIFLVHPLKFYNGNF